MTRGALTARLAATRAEVDEALALRHLVFRSRRGLDGPEGDDFDPISDHLLIHDPTRTLATFRTRRITRDDPSYTARHFDLSRLPDTPMLELGRFCLHPDAPAPDTLRLALAVLTALVDQSAVTHLIGCTSFEGTDLAPYAQALASHARLSPDTPARAPSQTLATLAATGPQRPLPPLLRHYLALGGSISDQAVIDPDLHTCHVLTLLNIADIPGTRAETLRAMTVGPGGSDVNEPFHRVNGKS